jgi:hypothetical protein
MASVEIWSASMRGGDERPVAGMPSLLWPDQWVPAHNGIYFVDALAKLPSVRFFNFETRKIQQVAVLPGIVRDWGVGLSISGDQRTLVYSLKENVAADIMLVEGFQ